MSDPGKAVFLSYASQDAEAAKRICDALRAAGVEVWFDAEGGLEHGDEWDAKIRRQIKECVLFLPIISANTQAREEGYFRIEWELAAQRALGIASGVAFILPIVIDDTKEPDALVPDRFRTVQWTRLRGGELTPEVKARFLKLWSHRAGVVKHQAEDGRQRTEDGGQGLSAGALAKPGWRAYAGLAAGIFALVAVVGWWLLRPSPPASGLPPAVSPPNPPPVSGLRPLDSVAASAARLEPVERASEARQLLEKARALYINRLDTSRDDCVLAEDLLKQAQGKEANDAEVWAALSHLHSYVFLRGWDLSNQRREAARAAAQRAVRLDPASFEGRLAEVFLLADTGPESLEKEKVLRALRAERPTEKRLLRALATVLDRRGELTEADALSDEAAALPGGDPLSLYNKSLRHWFAGNTDRAEAAMADTLRQAPTFTGALIFTAWYAANLHGDLERARATISRVPAAEMREDRPAYFAYFIELLARRPDAAIARLQAVPRAWLEDNWYRGPKAALVGDALQAGGRPAAAAIEWRTALRQIEEILQERPNYQLALIRRAQLLAKLGEREQAEIQFKTIAERAGISLAGDAPVPPWMTELLILLGRQEEAISQISRALRRERRAVDYTAATLRLDPGFDPARGIPAFAQVIAEAEAIEQAAATAKPARDWPKNPELKKAISLLDRLDAIPEDLRLAEEIAQGALDKAPTDPETVTAMARVQTTWLTRGWDRASDRYLKAQRVAERAVQLAPDEPQALAALAAYLLQRGTDQSRARGLIARAIELDPGSPRLHRLQNELRFFDAKVPREEAFASINRTLAQFPGDALVHYDASRYYRNAGRFEESEREVDATLALAPVANAMVWKARAEFGLHNNLPGMKAALDRVPARVRSIERTVFGYFIYAVMSGDHAVGVGALNDMPEPWMIDFDYRGPKALPLAALLELQGKPALARIQCEVALKEVKQRQATEPDDLFLKLVEAWALHGLGRDDEARAAVRIFNESIERPYRITRMNSWWFHPIACNLVLGERATALALVREAGEIPAGRETVRRFLASDPRLAAFRDDAEITALLQEPETAKP